MFQDLAPSPWVRMRENYRPSDLRGGWGDQMIAWRGHLRRLSDRKFAANERRRRIAFGPPRETQPCEDCGADVRRKGNRLRPASRCTACRKKAKYARAAQEQAALFVDSTRCEGRTKSGERCTRKPLVGGAACALHVRGESQVCA